MNLVFTSLALLMSRIPVIDVIFSEERS